MRKLTLTLALPAISMAACVALSVQAAPRMVLPSQNQSAIQQIGCTFASRCPLGRTWVCTQTIDPEAHRLFSSCENNVLVVIDADAGTIVATLPIGARSDGAAFDPKRKLIFSS